MQSDVRRAGAIVLFCCVKVARKEGERKERKGPCGRVGSSDELGYCWWFD